MKMHPDHCLGERIQLLLHGPLEFNLRSLAAPLVLVRPLIEFVVTFLGPQIHFLVEVGEIENALIPYFRETLVQRHHNR